MDARAGKRSTGGPITQRKGSTVAFRDAVTARDENVRFCNRRGCSGRIKYSQTTNFGTFDRSKCSRPSFCSSHGNGIIGTSKRNSVMTSAKKFNLDSRRKLFSQSESSVSGVSLGKSPTYQSKLGVNNSEKIRVMKSGSSNVSSNIRPHKPSVLPSSSNFLASKSIGSGPSKSSTVSRYSPRNLKSGSKPDVIPPSCSSVSKSITKNAMKKRIHEKETSSSRCWRKTATVSSSHKHASPSTSVTSISNSRPNSCIVGGESSATMSVRTQNPGNINQRMRPTNRQSRQNFSSIGERADTETLNNALSSDSSSNGNNSSTLMHFSLEDLGFNHLRNRHALPRDNLDVIAEVLLALERIDHAVLTHEQVLALEASFFHTGLNLFDQHRDMRMDIDSMSYEELLALEERMGTVSTALSEETLSKCIRRSIYQETPLEVRDTGSCEDGGDIKCSICQEEFELGDEVGTLIECDHGYHITCITQWLRLKNWCPICKGSAAPSQSFTSL